MSLRYFSVRLYKNGRYVLRALYQRNYSTNILENCAVEAKASATASARAPRALGLRHVGYQVGLQARRLFLDTLLGRVTTCLSSDLRRKATRRLMFGESAPLLALVGVSLAAGGGLLSREDELEGLCLEIRRSANLFKSVSGKVCHIITNNRIYAIDAISKFQWNTVSTDLNEGVFALEEITLERLTIGPPIAKGCSAIVYAAKFREDSDEAQPNSVFDNATFENEALSDFSRYPLALKMMFNYDIQSNAMSILRAMHREAVPARRYYSQRDADAWQSMFLERKVALPPHPNIVAMYSVFAEAVPALAGSMRLYPAALPARLNPHGYGRNMSLFLLMKRYQYSLSDYLKINKLSARNSILLLAQLLEAVTHINLYGIAHRDLKSDNILVEVGDTEVPVLVVTDFGCCLADYLHGLHLPFYSDQIDKGGNAALMAPEICNQRPGPFSVLNYTKSDVWAVGAIAYEIFGSENPFYKSSSKQGKALRNSTYRERELPALGEHVPRIMRHLLARILARNPNQRPTPEVAANVCQLYLWAPKSWSHTMPSSTQIIQWLLCLTTKVLYEGRLADSFAEGVREPRSRRTHPEYVLISSFLGRARLAQIKQALAFIHEHRS